MKGLKCKICGKTISRGEFEDRSVLIRHLREQHPNLVRGKIMEDIFHRPERIIEFILFSETVTYEGKVMDEYLDTIYSTQTELIESYIEVIEIEEEVKK